jgi:hypothetical protein
MSNTAIEALSVVVECEIVYGVAWRRYLRIAAI